MRTMMSGTDCSGAVGSPIRITASAQRALLSQTTNGIFSGVWGGGGGAVFFVSVVPQLCVCLNSISPLPEHCIPKGLQLEVNKDLSVAQGAVPGISEFSVRLSF